VTGNLSSGSPYPQTTQKKEITFSPDLSMTVENVTEAFVESRNELPGGVMPYGAMQLALRSHSER
jgi:hypothetical protein